MEKAFRKDLMWYAGAPSLVTAISGLLWENARSIRAQQMGELFADTYGREATPRELSAFIDASRGQEWVGRIVPSEIEGFDAAGVPAQEVVQLQEIHLGALNDSIAAFGTTTAIAAVLTALGLFYSVIRAYGRGTFGQRKEA